MTDNLFGEFVRDERKGSGISLRHLARLVQITPAYLSKLETGDCPPPSPEIIEAIADNLKVDVDVLFAKAGMVAPDLLRFLTSDGGKIPQILRALAKNDAANQRKTLLILGEMVGLF